MRQRTGELGIHIAFGASQGVILRSVVGNGLILSAVGVAFGVAVSLALGSVFATLVVGVAPYDRLTLATVGIILILVSTLASYVPARRAIRVGPMVALRKE